MKLYVDGEEYRPEDKEERAIAIEMWYDRHYKHWVLYPIDADGNQMQGAVYGFGKAEAIIMKEELEKEFGIR